MLISFAIFHNKEMNQGLNSVAFEFKLPDIGEGIHEGEIVNGLLNQRRSKRRRRTS